MCVCVPSTCVQAFVHQCDSGEALINSSPMLGYPPPISLNTHTKTQMRESRNGRAWTPPAKVLHSSLCPSVSAGLTCPHVHTPLIRTPPSIIHVLISS